MDTKARFAIVDDDVAAMANLVKEIIDYPDFVNVWTATTVEEAKQKIGDVCPDIIFVDIELPDGSGLDLIEEMRACLGSTYVVVFTGYYGSHSSDAFARDEDDYLLKPVLPNELDKVIQRYRHSVQQKHISSLPGDLILGELCGDEDSFAVLTPLNEVRIVRPREVGYFRYSSQRRVWEIAIIDGSFVQLRKSIRAEQILGFSKSFVQTHQSYIVNTRYLTLITGNKCTLFPPFNNDDVLVGRTFRAKLQKNFNLI